MYCINCGVKLADTEKVCPLCETAVYHPALTQKEEAPFYPQDRYPVGVKASKLLPVFLSVLFSIPLVIVLLSDWQMDQKISWSGYVVGALLLSYEFFALPLWFQKPNPVIFVPCSFTAIGLYVLYIDLVTAGGWFLTFALPVIGGVGLIVTAVVTLMRYVPKGGFFILGGAMMALGGLAWVTELLMNVTFHTATPVQWSYYPLTVLVLLGGLMLFLGISPSARETFRRKFFF